MNCDLMVQYIKFVADRLLVELECEKVCIHDLYFEANLLPEVVQDLVRGINFLNFLIEYNVCL